MRDKTSITNRILIERSLIIYVQLGKKNETKRPGFFCDKSLSKKHFNEIENNDYGGRLNGKRSSALVFMFSTFPSIQNNIQNIKYFCIIIFRSINYVNILIYRLISVSRSTLTPMIGSHKISASKYQL